MRDLERLQLCRVSIERGGLYRSSRSVRGAPNMVLNTRKLEAQHRGAPNMVVGTRKHEAQHVRDQQFWLCLLVLEFDREILYKSMF